MTIRELDRLTCIQGLIDGQLKQHAVAARLGLTTRQVRRLVRRYEQQGPKVIPIRPARMRVVDVSEPLGFGRHVFKLGEFCAGERPSGQRIGLGREVFRGRHTHPFLS